MADSTMLSKVQRIVVELNHEIRGPLMPLMTGIEILRRQGCNRKTLAMMDRQVRQIESVMEQLREDAARNDFCDQCPMEVDMIPSTVERVPLNTAQSVNAWIRNQTEDRLERYAEAGRPTIDRRLAELDQEWDIERTLEANAATASLIGLTLGATVDRRWFIFPALVAGFLLQHAVQGWCPPMPVLRRLGFRTQSEIDYERYALKALRGDFRNLSASDRDAGRTLEAVTR